MGLAELIELADEEKYKESSQEKKNYVTEVNQSSFQPCKHCHEDSLP